MSASPSKAHNILWIFTLVMLLLIAAAGPRSLDLQMHDTYYVISLYHVGLWMSFISLLSGAIYWLVRNKKLFAWMTMVHVLGVVFLFTLLSITLLWQSKTLGTAGPRVINLGVYTKASRCYLLGMGLFVLAHILFGVNISISLWRNQKTIGTK
ncbi:MAG: hypothetical protein AAFV25_20025 [Bacteroidota bacterium]